MSTSVSMTTSECVARIRFKSDNGINILSQVVRNELSQILKQIDRDGQIRIVLFEAEGRTFLAGAEIRELQQLTRDTAYDYARSGQELMNQIAELKALTACVIQGPCVGGGCELALACDFRLATQHARIGLPEVTLGLIPGWGGTVRGTRLLGAMKARRVILAGSLFNAHDALAIGLLDEVDSSPNADPLVNRFLQSALARPAGAVATAKQAISRFSDRGLRKALKQEAEMFADCYLSGEPTEGITAFLEKRPATWTIPWPVSVDPQPQPEASPSETLVPQQDVASPERQLSPPADPSTLDEKTDTNRKSSNPSRQKSPQTDQITNSTPDRAEKPLHSAIQVPDGVPVALPAKSSRKPKGEPPGKSRGKPRSGGKSNG